jgi:hypothetical protein
MSPAPALVRRHLGPPIQVLVDLAMLLLACLAAYELREHFAWRATTDIGAYREVFLLTGAVTLLCFRSFGLYGPIERRHEVGSIARGTILSFLIVHALIMVLRGTVHLPDRGLYAGLLELHRFLDLGGNQGLDGFWVFSRLTLVVAFVFIFAFTTLGRLASRRVIRHPRHSPVRG